MNKHALMILSFCSLLVSCNGRETGDGMGRPPRVEADRAERKPLEIVRVLPAPAESAFVVIELDEAAEESLELAGFQLLSKANSVSLSGTVQPGDTIDVEDISALQLSGSFDEVAVVDTNGQMHAYLAWGGDPGLVSSSLYLRAVADGAVMPGRFIEVPYPLPESIAIANETGNCADIAGSVIDCPESEAQLFLNEVNIQGNAVEIINEGEQALSLAGVRLCRSRGCVTFAHGQTIDPGSLLVVVLGDAEPAEPPAGRVYFPDATQLADAADLALLAPGPLDVTAAPNRLLSFVRWGEPAGQLVELAIEAGLWPDSETSVAAPGEGQSLVRTPGAHGAQAWLAAPASLGSENS